MTISSEVNRSGPYIGNGVTTVFDYGFQIVSENHIKVIKRDTAGVETILTIDADYIVSDVGNSSGGQVALTSALPNGETVTLLLNVPFLQQTDLENQGAYYAETMEAAFDLAAQRDLQLKEEIDRSVKIPASADTGSLDNLIADIIRLSGSADNIDTVANISDDVAIVAGISAQVTTVANRDADIGTVAARDAAIGVVAGIADKVTEAADNMAAIVDAPNQAQAAENAAAAAIQSASDAAESAASIDPTSIVHKADTDASAFGFFAGKAATPADPSKVVPSLERVDAETVYKVADRTSLKALDTSKHSVAVLLEGVGAKRGRFGRFFVGDYANYSAAVAADTQEGFVIRSTSDATKVWIRDASEACPEHFGAVADGATDDYTAISVGIAVADALAIPFKFYGSYAMGSSLTIPVTLRNIDSEPEAKITGINSVVNGVTVGGAPTRFGKIVLPSIFGFSGIGLTAIGGIMDLYIPEIVSCGTAVRIADGGGGATVRANFIGNCTLAIEFYMSSTLAVIQGSSVRGGFITNTPNIVAINGAQGACDGLIVEYDAIDVVTGGGIVFANNLGIAIPRFTFKCPSWFGGNGFSAATKTQLFSGQWNNCDFDITNALAFDQSHMTPGQPAATRWKMRNQGSSGGFALAGSLAAFNGGVMLCQTEFMVKTTLAAGLVAGGTVTARFYHILADSNYYNWQMTKCAGPAGAVVGAYSDFNSTEAGRVDITILNAGTTTIAAGTTIFIAVSRN